MSVCLCCDVCAAFVKILRSRSCVFGCKGVDLVVFFDVEAVGEDCSRVLISGVQAVPKAHNKKGHPSGATQCLVFSQERRRHHTLLSILLAFAECMNEGKELVFWLSCEIWGLEDECFTPMETIGT